MCYSYAKLKNPWIVLREKQKKTPHFFILELIAVCLNFAGMQRSKNCETCGNPIPAQAFTCQFCNASQSVENFPKTRERVIRSNLEAGLPTVEQALERLERDLGMNRGDRLQSDRGHRLHIDWGVCPGKMSYQWNRNNDLLIWRKAVGLR